jgi:glycosyltransferase 2 family protein
MACRCDWDSDDLVALTDAIWMSRVKPGMRRMLLVLVGLLVGGLFLWLALRGTSLDEIKRAMGRANLLWSMPLMLALASFCWLKSYRWAVLLHPVASVSAAQLVKPVIIGYAGTMLLPLQLGELIRTVITGRRFGAPIASVLGSITVERVLDLLALLVILGIAGLLGSGLPDLLRTVSVVLLAGAILSWLMLVGLAVWMEAFVRAVAPVVGVLPEGMGRRTESLLLEMVAA